MKLTVNPKTFSQEFLSAICPIVDRVCDIKVTQDNVYVMVTNVGLGLTLYAQYQPAGVEDLGGDELSFAPHKIDRLARALDLLDDAETVVLNTDSATISFVESGIQFTAPLFDRMIVENLSTKLKPSALLTFESDIEWHMSADIFPTIKKAMIAAPDATTLTFSCNGDQVLGTFSGSSSSESIVIPVGNTAITFDDLWAIPLDRLAYILNHKNSVNVKVNSGNGGIVFEVIDSHNQTASYVYGCSTLAKANNQ